MDKNKWTVKDVLRVVNQYDGDHDLGPDAPVTWREEHLAQAVLEMNDEIETLKAQVKALLDAVPSAKVKA